MAKLKNYKSNTPNTFDRIQKCLVAHGAKKLLFEYDNQGRIIALSFALDLAGQEHGFTLPARVENVERIFSNQKIDKWGYKKDLTVADKDQAYRTAWANIRDWVEAQMALIETEQVKFEEVFLPYMQDGTGKTLFERMQDDKFLLEGPKNG